MSISLPVLNLEYETNQAAGSKAREQKNYNWSEIENKYSLLGVFLQGALDGYELRFNNMIKNAEQVNEVVDARVDNNNIVYPTLKARLDNAQETTPEIMSTGVLSTATSVLLLKDLTSTVSTTGLYYTNSKQVDNITLPSLGYSECNVAKISYNTIATL